jgi:hypothetical protein
MRVVVGCELAMDQPGCGHHEVFGDGGGRPQVREEMVGAATFDVWFFA